MIVKLRFALFCLANLAIVSFGSPFDNETLSRTDISPVSKNTFIPSHIWDSKGKMAIFRPSLITKRAKMRNTKKFLQLFLLFLIF